MVVACHICKSECRQQLPTGDREKIICPRCGEYSITGSAAATWSANNPTGRQIVNASGWIREHQSAIIGSNDVEKLLTVEAPSIGDRATKLLIELAKKYKGLGADISIKSNEATEWLGITYCTDKSELGYLLITYLTQELGFLAHARMVGDNYLIFHGGITPKGYVFLDSLKHSPSNSQIGFCAMWFDAELTLIWTNAISPAIKDAGYEPKRIDGHQHNNKIDDEIIAMIRRSKFVVADFTGQRGGVYFEAGFALGLGLPVIWTCEKSELEKVHFDNRQYNFVLWEKDKLSEFKQALQSRIEATLGRGIFA